MTDILIQPNADGDDNLTNGIVIDDATLPLSNEDAVALGMTLGTAYKLRVLGTPQTLTVTDVPAAFVTGNWSAATGSGANEIDVTISALPAANGQTITDVEYELDASGTWVSSGGTTSFTITAAAGGTSYDIRLRAVNSNGAAAAGDSKAATSGAAATAPAQMSAPTVTATGSDSISVDRAAPPADGGSAITSYDLQWQPDGGSWTTVTGITDPQTVGSLTASTLYNVQTRAVNAVDAGPWSTSGSATTDAASGTIVFSEPFSYADNTRLWDTADWTVVGNDLPMRVVSGQALMPSGGWARVKYSENSGVLADDQYSQIEVITAPASGNDRILLYTRFNEVNDTYVLSCISGEINLYRDTVIIWTGSAISDGDIIRLECQGATVSVFVNGVQQHSVDDAGNGGATTGTTGFLLEDGCVVDNFETGDL